MFVRAIDTAASFTRPIHTVGRTYGSTTPVPGAATLFFVNSDGWALTCAHVARQLAASDEVFAKSQAFNAELAALPRNNKYRQRLRDLERKYGYGKGIAIQILNSFVNCVEGPLDVDVHIHNQLDVALLKFNRFTKLLCTSFPVFATNGGDLKQGKFLCRLGFPFPEFTNFEYDKQSDRIRWTQTGRPDTPRFPIEGMVTRHLQGTGGAVIGFEMSTPGLRGQSGGPAFDSDGRVWGMQAATGHLDLDFDVDTEVLRQGEKRRVRDSAFLHVGHCIHLDVLKAFMGQFGVVFAEG